MKYRLKDDSLERLLNRLSEGTFSKRFNLACEHKSVLTNSKVVVYFGGEDNKKFSATFSLDEILRNHRFLANHWNKYPETLPPDGRLMWCWTSEGKIVKGRHMYWNDKESNTFRPRWTDENYNKINCEYFMRWRDDRKVPTQEP